MIPIRVAMEDGAYETREGVLCPDCSHLSIVRYVVPGDDLLDPETVVWTLTHVPTGLALGDAFASEDAALVAMNHVSALGLDWSSADPATYGAWPERRRARVKKALGVGP